MQQVNWRPLRLLDEFEFRIHLGRLSSVMTEWRQSEDGKVSVRMGDILIFDIMILDITYIDANLDGLDN